MQIKINLTPILGELTPKEFTIKCLKIFSVFFLIFYYIYPAALSVRGGSMVAPMGVIGIALYAYNRFPFKEVSRVIFFFILILLCAWIAERLSGVYQNSIMGYAKPQMGWFFYAYVICFIMFNVHKKITLEIMVGYIAAAVFVQSVITLLMYFNPDINEFFNQFVIQTEIEDKREFFEKMRLVGYGSALFGGGMIAGVGLIMQAYLIAKVHLSKMQLIGMTIVYCFTFFVGLFTARTVLVGAAFSLILLVYIALYEKRIHKGQYKGFVVFCIIFFFVGFALSMVYLKDFTDWAFEMWYNFQATGKFQTQSSNTLVNLFAMPTGSYREMLWGLGIYEFFGNDMGFTRLLFWFGIVGTIAFFLYMFVIWGSIRTKDKGANALVLTIVIYAITLNIKGLTDLNSILYLFFFFFMFYKYYRYYPNLYLSKLIEREKYKKALNEKN